MNELERIEAAATRDAALAAGGMAEHVGGALCVANALIPISVLNRALPLGAAVDLEAIERWYADAGVGYIVQVTPDRASLAAELARRGYERGHAWMKFQLSGEPAAAIETELQIELTNDADAFAQVAVEGFDLPPFATALVTGVVGRPGWRCFLARADGEPAAAGALFVDGAAGWLGIAATRPAYRGRGAQNALLHARIRAGREAGAGLLATETGERLPDRPAASYRNILRAGFREAYLRENWQSPRSGG